MTVPGREDLFLVNPQGLHWSEITPSDLVMADGAGNIVEGKYPVEATAFFIHARIHAGNPRAKVVLHTHMPYATALTSIQRRPHRDVHPERLPLLEPHRLRRGLCRRGAAATRKATACAAPWATRTSCSCATTA